MSWQCLNIRPGVGGMFTRGPSRSRDNSAPAPINSGSQQRSLHCAPSPATRAGALSVCQHRNYLPRHLIFDLFAWNRRYSDCGFVPRRRQIFRGSAEGECVKWIEHQMCIGEWRYFNYEEWKLWDVSIHRNVFILLLLLQFNFNNPYTNIQEQHHIKWD